MAIERGRKFSDGRSKMIYGASCCWSERREGFLVRGVAETLSRLIQTKSLCT
jgi:hypothetical protein